MGAQTLEKDTFETPQINPWRQMPTSEQIRYATDLCRSELPYAERVHTIASFAALDRPAMSELIDQLARVRAQRTSRLRRGRKRSR